MIEFIVIALAVVGPLIAWKLWPQTTERVAAQLIASKRVLFGLFGIIVGVGLILSGAPLYMLVGALILGYAVVALVYNKPHEELL